MTKVKQILWRRAFQAERAVGPEVGAYLLCLRKSKETRMTASSLRGWERGSEEVRWEPWESFEQGRDDTLPILTLFLYS